MVGRRHNSTSRELRVAILCAHRAPGLEYLLKIMTPGRWRIVVGLTSDEASYALDALEGASVPVLKHDIRAFYRARAARLADLAVREQYDRATVDMLRPLQPDLIVLSGYLHIVTAPLLSTYPNRIVNVHDADLAVVDEAGRPRYSGLRATRDAIVAGEPETRCSAHVATAEVDGGPLLVRSWRFPTHALVQDARKWGAVDILSAYAYAQREWMMRAAWGPVLAHAINLYAQDCGTAGPEARAVIGLPAKPSSRTPRLVEMAAPSLASEA